MTHVGQKLALGAIGGAGGYLRSQPFVDLCRKGLIGSLQLSRPHADLVFQFVMRLLQTLAVKLQFVIAALDLLQGRPQGRGPLLHGRLD